MTSVMYANILRKRKDFRTAEQVLLAGINYTLHHQLKYEHAFWSIANLYLHQVRTFSSSSSSSSTSSSSSSSSSSSDFLFAQGDPIAFIKYSEEGMKHMSHEPCRPAITGCQVPDFELDIVTNLYNTSLQVCSTVAVSFRPADPAPPFPS